LLRLFESRLNQCAAHSASARMQKLPKDVIEAGRCRTHASKPSDRLRRQGRIALAGQRLSIGVIARRYGD
jgi:hypothetical protein